MRQNNFLNRLLTQNLYITPQSQALQEWDALIVDLGKQILQDGSPFHSSSNLSCEVFQPSTHEAYACTHELLSSVPTCSYNELTAITAHVFSLIKQPASLPLIKQHFII